MIARPSPKALRWARLALIATSIALTVGGMMVLYQRIDLLPRSTRRALTDDALRVLLFAYASAVVALPLLFIGSITYLIRERARRRRHPRIAKMALALFVGLVSLGLLEGLSGAWWLWRARVPALPETFATSSPPGTSHIVVIGGSSALGEPFRDHVSIGPILAWKLGEAEPARRFETTVLARLGASLDDMHEALRSLERRPDLLLIYAGHNEFTALYEEERGVDELAAEGDRFWGLPLGLVRRTPFGRLILFVVSRNRLDGPPPAISRHRVIDPPQASPEEIDAVRAAWSRRLEAILSWCDRIECRALVVLAPSNEADLEPSRSTLPDGVSAVDRAWVESAMSTARASGPAAAAKVHRSILKQYPGFAEAHYRLGRYLLDSGDIAGANREFIAARDSDGLITRCRTDFLDEARTAVARHPSALLVDGPAVLRAASPRGVVGDDTIIDMHHPSLFGMTELARACLDQIVRTGALGTTPGSTAMAPFTASDVAAHFKLDPAAWSVACDRTRVHYERIAGYRYDTTERLARASAFAAAAKALRSGTIADPDELHLIGLGTGPRASASATD
jgi:hypothetical protein